MAGRIRTIKPELLDDEIASALSDTAWRLFVSSWLLADDHGRFRAGARYLAASVWQDTGRAQDAEDALAELARAGRIRVYEVDGQRYAEIPTWPKHQRIDNAGKPRVPAPPIGAINDYEKLARVSPRVAESRRESPLEPPRPAALPPTSDLRPPTDGTSDPSGGYPGPSAPSPPPTEQARESHGQGPIDRQSERESLPKFRPKPVPVDRPQKPESPEQLAWRTWRAAYSAHYRRAYPAQTTDGPAMKRAVKLAQDMLVQLERPASDLEALLMHRWRAYLADPGQSRQPGGPGYLRETAHRLQDLERGLAAYGTPWDRQPQRQARAEPRIEPAPRERGGVRTDDESPGPPPTGPPARMDVVGMFGNGRRT